MEAKSPPDPVRGAQPAVSVVDGCINRFRKGGALHSCCPATIRSAAGVSGAPLQFQKPVLILKVLQPLVVSRHSAQLRRKYLVELIVEFGEKLEKILEECASVDV